MRFTLLLTAALTLGCVSSAGAFDTGPVSFRAFVGTSSPTIDDPRMLPAQGDGLALGAGLAVDLGFAIRLTATFDRHRYPVGAAGVITIPEIRFLGASPTTLTTALIGLELHAPWPGSRRTSAYLGLSEGISWLHEGDSRFYNMNGPSYTSLGARDSGPALEGAAGVRFASGVGRLVLDLGWREVRMWRRTGDVSAHSLRVGVEI